MHFGLYPHFRQTSPESLGITWMMRTTKVSFVACVHGVVAAAGSAWLPPPQPRLSCPFCLSDRSRTIFILLPAVSPQSGALAWKEAVAGSFQNSEALGRVCPLRCSRLSRCAQTQPPCFQLIPVPDFGLFRAGIHQVLCCCFLLLSVMCVAITHRAYSCWFVSLPTLF